jgi:hypothetical protein
LKEKSTNEPLVRRRVVVDDGRRRAVRGAEVIEEDRASRDDVKGVERDSRRDITVSLRSKEVGMQRGAGAAAKGGEANRREERTGSAAIRDPKNTPTGAAQNLLTLRAQVHSNE